VRRARRVEGVDDVVVATSTEAADDLVAAACGRLGVGVVRGSLLDVLARYVAAARETRADAVVRITSDCPLLDPARSGDVVRAFLAERPDYASNVMERRLPRGLDTEIVSTAALLRADAEARGEDREHVTKHVYGHPEAFRCLSVRGEEEDLSAHRWTLDTLEDYRFLCAVATSLGSRIRDAGMREVLAALAAQPGIVGINREVRQKGHG
jgi:spore coat polysaccharide biosynthesis protein SpsF